MTTRALFWDVDTQVDFMHADGKLYVPGSVEIIPALERLTRHAHDHGIRIIASADDHVPGHRELSDSPDFVTTFPEHCMRGTPGQRKITETALRNPLVIDPSPRDSGELAEEVRAHDGDILFLKHWFDVFTNPNVTPVVTALAPARIVLYGVALDVCNRYAINGLLERFPGTPISLVTDATRAIDPARSETLMADWSARGVSLTTTDEVRAA
ncbi:MAG: cysteine hydrolase family protein [Gemmatimonadota bacterium]|nr:cysteine hydrolase family protein [Gemmatimonadota bacterium]